MESDGSPAEGVSGKYAMPLNDIAMKMMVV
jgi:hypothetical protein